MRYSLNNLRPSILNGLIDPYFTKLELHQQIRVLELLRLPAILFAISSQKVRFKRFISREIFLYITNNRSNVGDILTFRHNEILRTAISKLVPGYLNSA
ncbi:hypothetical protein CDAR_531041 [Caerostris darwini]|uniref:Maturase K n=1 Tax=Caerostris darwini TaxID=1538125 RepID=A0AAV4VSN0_9ARAC|nr:hypothetical protein CDAR_531041 [Caerostris darwini]